MPLNPFPVMDESQPLKGTFDLQPSNLFFFQKGKSKSLLFTTKNKETLLTHWVRLEPGIFRIQAGTFTTRLIHSLQSINFYMSLRIPYYIGMMQRFDNPTRCLELNKFCMY